MEIKTSNVISDETICCLNSVNCKVLSVERQRYANLIKISLVEFSYKFYLETPIYTLFQVRMSGKRTMHSAGYRVSNLER